MTKPRITLPNTEYDRGFENGALAAREAIEAFLKRTGKADEADAINTAWNSNTLVEPARPLPDLSEVP